MKPFVPCSMTFSRQHGLDAFRSGLADPGDVPAIPDHSYVSAGDLDVLGDHRLLCGDATDAADVARRKAGPQDEPTDRRAPECEVSN